MPRMVLRNGIAAALARLPNGPGRCNHQQVLAACAVVSYDARMNDPSAQDAAQDTADVRMRGFQQRTSAAEALRWLDEHVAALEPEFVPLHEAAGRILAEDVSSSFDVPAFDRAMMDGYALRGATTQGASTFNPLMLRVVGEGRPGKAFEGELESGQAVRIMTGAPLPRGADAVLPAELAQCKGDQLSVQGEILPGKHVGFRGEDIVAGGTVLASGRHLRPQDLGVLSSVGLPQVPVVRRPRVRIIITGNELLPAGAKPQPHHVFDANGPMLHALVERDGGRAMFDGIVPDDPRQLMVPLSDPDADVVLVSGGSSVGEEDHAPRLLSELGELAIHGIAMRPGSPAGLGRIENCLVFLLPGNPVACLWAYDFLAGRAIRSLGGRSKSWPYPVVRLPLRRQVISTVGRLDCVRVVIAQGQAEPVSAAGASVLSSTTRASGFLVIPENCEGYLEGQQVDVYLYDPQ